MLSEWSAECSADDPGRSPGRPRGLTQTSSAHFIDLRAENPTTSQKFPRPSHYNLPLGRALRALNATRSPSFTAKCDAWQLDCGRSGSSADTLEALRLQLELLRHRPGPLWLCQLHRSAVARTFEPYSPRPISSRTALTALPAAPRSYRIPKPRWNASLRPAMLDLNGPLEGFACHRFMSRHSEPTPRSLATWSTSHWRTVVHLLRAKSLNPRAAPLQSMQWIVSRCASASHRLKLR